ncbi:MAG: serine/threonine-protein kinase [Steroidobacteraceae bacterium]
MHQLGTELGRFVGGSIDGKQLRAVFSDYLADNPEQSLMVAGWLKQSVETGRLSASVWVLLHDLFEERTPAAAEGPGGITRVVVDPPARRASNTPAAADEELTRRQTDPPQVATIRHAARPAAQTSGPLRTGMVVRERFVLMEELGSGGMGKVFKARDLRREEAQDRNPFIALKILKAEVSAHPDSFMALQREARRAGSLAHPNVVTVYDFDRDGDRIYMTMEYLEGRPLDSWLRSEYANGIPLAQAWPIVKAIGAALECGHQKRIVHSDLKPGNIYVCNDGVVKVLDFGISRLVRPTDGKTDETIFDPGKRFGGLTPAYASLEMWTHDTPDPRDDIYALACVTYELLTGKHPFGRASARDVKEKKLTPVRPPGLTRPQWESIRKGLALHRAQRTSTVREFLQELEPRSVWRRHALALTSGAAVVAIAAVVIGARYYRDAVEDSTMEIMQCAQIIKPAVVDASTAPAALTPQRRQEIEENLLLANDYLADAKPDTPLDDLKSMLSDGPNSVIDILDSVLASDPKQAEALKMKSKVADIYASRAKKLLDENRTTQALELVRYGRNVVPSSQDLFRLEQRVCRADAVKKAAVGKI